MEDRSSRSDNPIVVVLLAVSLAAAAHPMVSVLRALAAQPAAPFPSLMLLAALIAASYFVRVRDTDLPAWVAPVTLLGLSIRLLYYPGRHWADIGWLLTATGDIFALRVQLAALLIMGGAWAVGIGLAINGVEHDRTIEHLGTALWVLVAGTVLAGLGALRGNDIVRAAASRSVALFFASAMAALAVSRLTTVRRAAARSGNRAGAWEPWAILAGLIAFGIAVVLATSVDAAIPPAVLRTLRFLLDLIAGALDIILYPVALVVAWLYLIVKALMRGWQGPEAVAPDEGDGVLEWVELDRLGESTVNLRWVAAVIVCVAGFILLSRLLRRPLMGRHGQNRPYFEERLSVDGQPLMRRRPARIRRRGEGQLDAVRAAFKDVLDWLSAHGLTRAPSVTASEFAARTVRRLDTDGAAALDELVREYLPIRYGQTLADAGAVRRVRALAARVKNADLSANDGAASGGENEGR